MGKQARVLVPATTANLGAGFDCMGMALELYNCFDFQLGSNEFSVTGEGQQELESDRGQLVYRAWDAAHAYRSRSAPSVKLHIESRIPIGRGLGSSATAVIAGLYAANHLGGLCLSTAELLSLATMIEGHPDNIAPALLGGLVVTAKEDNHSEVDYLVLDSCEELQVILAVPRFELSTSKARSVLPEKVPYKDAVFNVGRAALFIAAWTKKRWEVLGKAMADRLHQPFRAALVPGLEEVLTAAVEAGAVGAALSGAGPSVVALTIGNADEVGKVMQQAFIDHGIECEIIETRPAIKGAHLAG
ncbi:MAG: homoserine kinase [Firmicutes bacterium]|nr:homoserine kinase [Bacillota bacterium]